MKIFTEKKHWVLVLLVFTSTILISCGTDDPEYPIQSSPDLVDRGRVLYSEYCFSCHGDATTRPQLNEAPTHAADGHTWHHPDRLLVQWIRNGVPNGQIMPEFSTQMTELETQSVVGFIKTFWPPQIVEEQEKRSSDYESRLVEDDN